MTLAHPHLWDGVKDPYLGFTLRFDAGQHLVCGKVVLADPAEATLVPQRERQ